MGKNDELIKKWMQENKKEFSDSGFTKDTISRLPKAERMRFYHFIYGFIIFGLIIYWALNERISMHWFFSLWQSPTLYYLLGGVFVFPLLVLVVICFFDKNYKLI